MIRALAFVLALIAVVAATELPYPSEVPDAENSSVQILTPDQLKLYLAENPDAVLTPLESVATKAAIRYTLGSRVKGDVVVASPSNSYPWSSPRNFKLSLRYPPSGVGRIVTFVNIIVEQSTYSGRAYAVSGGIGSRFIQIIIESYNTTYLRFTARIYGL